MNRIVFYSLLGLFMIIMNSSCNDPDDIGSLPPTVSVLPATGVQPSSAVFNGTVNANGLTTSVYFEWGTTMGYGNEIEATPDLVTGAADTPVSATISSLQEGTIYHYRIKAVNAIGISYSNDMSFSTPFDPRITITDDDDAHNIVEQFSMANYIDPGATAIDIDGSPLAVTVTGSVNMNSAADYVLVYSAMDSYGVTHTASRTVTVSGGKFLQGNYTVENFVEGTSTGTYNELVSVSSLSANRINVIKFGSFVNGGAFMTISGTTITIPAQDITCGNPSALHTFTGSGTYSSGSNTFTINYTDVSLNGTFSCQGIYTLQ